MNETQFRIEEGSLGTQMIVFSEWTAEMRDQLLRHKVQDLHLRSPRCVPDNDLSFLREFHWLKGLTLFKTHVDIEPLECLRELRRLYLVTISKHVLQFDAFPHLSDLSVSWHASVKKLVQLRSIRSLFIDHPPKTVIPHVGEMTDLEDLALLSCPAEDLSPLGNLSKLTKLRITLFRKNTGNAFVSNLVNLEEYFIQDSKGFTSFEPLRNLSKLKKIAVSESGPYDSLGPLRNLKRLEHFGIGDPVLDGDYSPVEDMPQLQYYCR